MEEEINLDKFEEGIVDDSIFAGTTIAQNQLFKYLKIPIPPDGLARNLFHGIIRYIYEVIPPRYIDLIGYEPLDKFLIMLGPQLVFSSMYTRSNLAALSDILNMSIVMLKDIAAEQSDI